ncbi:hypothetical protein [Vulcanisaeta souniana]|uniref:hypothetical protein n=1 Tax=Vulcanisaeta souniana TaxID=164452 RepID=UPI001669EE85|nr:hypothetical protein [Vulcanisaeta souniana]
MNTYLRRRLYPFTIAINTASNLYSIHPRLGGSVIRTNYGVEESFLFILTYQYP